MYDVALSFAGEDREYVQQVADILHEIGIRVFYDVYEEVDLWGKDLYTHLDDIYRVKSRHCIMFISKYYKEKLWTNHERASAQARAFIEKSEYILPVRFDNTEIPGIRQTTGYLDLNKYSPEQFATLVARKVKPDYDVDLLIDYLKKWLVHYEINVVGTEIEFKCEAEEYYGKFPLRLLLDMYRLNQLDHMFLHPSIVPW
ncbi:hypothetical protein T458_11560 [Brevibacillus panacihumi W25]|uniref:TIR domain-containing protein n=1 Tax=Brevibacillus panacihumi W25 TaxID=1408254 RepID=V6MGH7_9BACL|nr:TIR domain-containing protein [Brevibacillus panacihumi]EST54528.1 hypothetical protein T458_11560 [Brevibacillus panacihumi W25]